MAISEVFHSALLENANIQKEYYLLEYEKRRRESQKYKNSKIFHYALTPYFYTENMYIEYQKICSKILSIGRKVLFEYARNRNLRELYGYSEQVTQCILNELKVSNEFPIARIDVYFDKGQLRIYEINSEGAAGMKKDIKINSSLLASPVLKALGPGFRSNNIVEGVTEKLIEKFKQWSGNNVNEANNNIAILFGNTNDYEDSCMFCDHLINHGYNAFGINYKDVVYYDKQLYHNGINIHMVVNDFVHKQFFDEINLAQSYMYACQESCKCFNLGCFKGLIVNSNVFFSILFNPDYQYLFDQDDIDFIQAHIPYTTYLSNESAQLYELKRNKNQWVIKANDSYGGRGVYIGKLMHEHDWNLVVDQCSNGRYIAQHYIHSDTKRLFYLNDNLDLVSDDFIYTLGLFCCYESLCGIFSRASLDDIITGHGPREINFGNILWEG